MTDEQVRAQVANFEVKAIETFLGIPFEGRTMEDKEIFVEKHRAERVKFTTQLLKEAYEESVQEEQRGQNGQK